MYVQIETRSGSSFLRNILHWKIAARGCVKSVDTFLHQWLYGHHLKSQSITLAIGQVINVSTWDYSSEKRLVTNTIEYTALSLNDYPANILRS